MRLRDITILGKEECFFFPDLKAGEEIEFEFQVLRHLHFKIQKSKNPFSLMNLDSGRTIIPVALKFKFQENIFVFPLKIQI